MRVLAERRNIVYELLGRLFESRLARTCGRRSRNLKQAHTAKEKFWLTWISIGLTSLALFGLISTLPTPEDRLANLHQRIDREMKVLADFANRYHTEHSAYPDKAVWKRSDDVTIATLGRDGLDGGSDEDADFSAHFHPTRRGSPAE